MGYGIFEPWHLVLVLVIVLMVFGPGKLPSVGRGIGDAFRELKKATREEPPKTADLPPSSAETATGAAARVCKTCGTGVAPDQKFCANCGARVADPGPVSSPR
jgi:sec-independent protein translocase protein TatA